MVVFAVIAVITGIGIAGLTQFRQTVQLQEATTSFISTVRSTQNKARTGTLSRFQIRQAIDCVGLSDPTTCLRRPDAFAVYFDSVDNYSIYYCTENTAAGITSLTCGVEDPDVKAREFKDIKIYPDNASESTCRGLVFERLTGEISGIGQTVQGVQRTTGICKIEIKVDARIKTLEINLTENSISQY